MQNYHNVILKLISNLQPIEKKMRKKIELLALLKKNSNASKYNNSLRMKRKQQRKFTDDFDYIKTTANPTLE